MSFVTILQPPLSATASAVWHAGPGCALPGCCVGGSERGPRLLQERELRGGRGPSENVVAVRKPAEAIDAETVTSDITVEQGADVLFRDSFEG